NRAKNGDHYWVLAHVTPTFDAMNNITGFHSNRRTPNKAVLNQTIIPLYDSLLAVENQNPDRKAGMEASFNAVLDLLKEKDLTYDELIASLI
ncbi:MAG: chemotaxis protein, partial [Rhodospirillaceae bacterium]|nr:chemotaxis protein [Rhodospirillaceae bacterium]